MSSFRRRLLEWTADLEDDVGDPGRMRVFVPSIMGAGILVSLGILIGDLVRSIAGRGGEVRRRARTSRAAHALVIPLADALGASLAPVPRARRRLRTRAFYLAAFVAGVALALYVAIGSTFNYLREDGYLEGVLWVELVAITASAFFLAVGVAALGIAVRYPVVPRWVRPVIDRSPLGVREP